MLVYFQESDLINNLKFNKYNMKKFALLFFVAFFFTGIAFSQQVSKASNNKPLITIEPSISMDLPIMDLKASNGIGGFWNFEDYGASSGFGGSLTTKVAVYNSKKIQLRTFLTLGYSHFVNDDNRAFVGFSNSKWVHPGFPYINSTTGQQGFTIKDTAGISNMRMNMPSIAVGCEIGVYTDSKNRSSFNFGFDYNFSWITGRYYQTIAGEEETWTTLRINIRTGIGLSTSYSYKFTDNLGINVGTRFVMPNLFYKGSEMSDRDANVELLDEVNTAISPNLKSSRNMGYFKFFGGFSFFIGKM
jgi:hypothetical protein